MTGLGSKEKGKAAPIVPGFKMKGDTIAGRYRIEKLLGAGSSGFVVAARHVYLRRRVTLKILTSTTTAHQQAQRHHLAAAHQAAALRGLHVARIVDTGFTEDGLPFVATERLEGRTLAEELAERTSLPPAEAVRWILQACEGLAEAHSAGVVHGDLKPQNLFLTGASDAAATDQGGESRVLKILDFGMATPADDREDEGTAVWFASPAYLSPEQIRDPASVDARADVWALGVILHELIAGSLPFAADTVSGMLVAVAYDEPALLVAEGVPFELARAVRACLAKEPSERPADVAVLAKVLAPFAGAEGVGLARRVDAALSTRPPMAMTVHLGADDDGAAAGRLGAGARGELASADASARGELASADASARGGDDGRAHGVHAGSASAPESTAGVAARVLEALRPAAAREPTAGVAARVLRVLRPASGGGGRRGAIASGARSERAVAMRRRGAIAVVGAAAILAVVGLLTPASTPAAAEQPRRDTIDVPALPAPATRVEDLPPAPAEAPPSPAPLSVEAPTSTPEPSPADEAARSDIVGSSSSAAPATTPHTPRPARQSSSDGAPARRAVGGEPRAGKPRASLAVRDNPYTRGFTHPKRLPERRK
ncbi:MAG: protein kinase [Labilithrix sp.]|nr:protein kinase [Labilithrix sp.]